VRKATLSESAKTMKKDFKGKTDEEVEHRINTMKKDFEARYATYIGNALLKFQDREAIMAPYNFK
jgi:uncharacterized protein YeeX (DUF496 family)